LFCPPGIGYRSDKATPSTEEMCRIFEDIGDLKKLEDLKIHLSHYFIKEIKLPMFRLQGIGKLKSLRKLSIMGQIMNRLTLWNFKELRETLEQLENLDYLRINSPVNTQDVIDFFEAPISSLEKLQTLILNFGTYDTFTLGKEVIEWMKPLTLSTSAW